MSDHIVNFLRTTAWEKGKDPEKLHISYADWRGVAKRVKQRFPQAANHLRRLDTLFEQYDKDKSGTLDFGELRELLFQIDSKLTSLPATAQRAHQQGQYLGRKFNKIAQAAPGMALNNMDYGDIDDAVYKAFEYKHLGSLAYIGNAAIFDWNGYGLSGGLIAVYLWRSVYFAQSVSLRTRVLLAMDWTKRALFGRGESTPINTVILQKLTRIRYDELLDLSERSCIDSFLSSCPQHSRGSPARPLSRYSITTVQTSFDSSFQPKPTHSLMSARAPPRSCNPSARPCASTKGKRRATTASQHASSV